MGSGWDGTIWNALDGWVGLGGRDHNSPFPTRYQPMLHRLHFSPYFQPPLQCPLPVSASVSRTKICSVGLLVETLVSPPGLCDCVLSV